MKHFKVEYEMTPEIEEALNYAIKCEGSLRSMAELSTAIAWATRCEESAADDTANALYGEEAMARDLAGMPIFNHDYDYSRDTHQLVETGVWSNPGPL